VNEKRTAIQAEIEDTERQIKDTEAEVAEIEGSGQTDEKTATAHGRAGSRLVLLRRRLGNLKEAARTAERETLVEAEETAETAQRETCEALQKAAAKARETLPRDFVFYAQSTIFLEDLIKAYRPVYEAGRAFDVACGAKRKAHDALRQFDTGK
jgi:hypothetical protein